MYSHNRCYHVAPYYNVLHRIVFLDEGAMEHRISSNIDIYVLPFYSFNCTPLIYFLNIAISLKLVVVVV